MQVHRVYGQCPLSPWTMSTESMEKPLSTWTVMSRLKWTGQCPLDSMDIVHGIHGLSSPVSLWTLSMDSVQQKCCMLTQWTLSNGLGGLCTVSASWTFSILSGPMSTDYRSNTSSRYTGTVRTLSNVSMDFLQLGSKLKVDLFSFSTNALCIRIFGVHQKKKKIPAYQVNRLVWAHFPN